MSLITYRKENSRKNVCLGRRVKCRNILKRKGSMSGDGKDTQVYAVFWEKILEECGYLTCILMRLTC